MENPIKIYDFVSCISDEYKLENYYSGDSSPKSIDTIPIDDEETGGDIFLANEINDNNKKYFSPINDSQDIADSQKADTEIGSNQNISTNVNIIPNADINSISHTNSNANIIANTSINLYPNSDFNTRLYPKASKNDKTFINANQNTKYNGNINYNTNLRTNANCLKQLPDNFVANMQRMKRLDLIEMLVRVSRSHSLLLEELAILNGHKSQLTSENLQLNTTLKSLLISAHQKTTAGQHLDLQNIPGMLADVKEAIQPVAVTAVNRIVDQCHILKAQGEKLAYSFIPDRSNPTINSNTSNKPISAPYSVPVSSSTNISIYHSSAESFSSSLSQAKEIASIFGDVFSQLLHRPKPTKNTVIKSNNQSGETKTTIPKKKFYVTPRLKPIQQQYSKQPRKLPTMWQASVDSISLNKNIYKFSPKNFGGCTFYPIPKNNNGNINSPNNNFRARFISPKNDPILKAYPYFSNIPPNIPTKTENVQLFEIATSTSCQDDNSVTDDEDLVLIECTINVDDQILPNLKVFATQKCCDVSETWVDEVWPILQKHWKGLQAKNSKCLSRSEKAFPGSNPIINDSFLTRKMAIDALNNFLTNLEEQSEELPIKVAVPWDDIII